MATEVLTGPLADRSGAQSTNNGVSSISVVDAPPRLAITLSQTDPAPTIYVEGMTFGAAAKIDWVSIAKGLGGLILDHILGPGGDGGGGGKNHCTTVTIEHPDGSTDKVTHCDPGGLV